ncbi:hypothetical protein GCM10023332_02590 [Luteimonas vadosa]|uniref:Copper resistance protein NlpE n=1 Tax=Luteimonas vadosa TaxID=1165507 RepID=A0ABP9DQS5_9GAMM
MLPLVAACLLSACEPAPEPPSPALPQLGQADGRVQWRGLLACADCDGIEALLVLERQGDVHRYDLVETFLAGPEGARFAESGQWRLEDGMLRLQGERGALRLYALLPDGRLQPRDGRGRPFRRRDGDFLVPADADVR